MSYMYLNRFFTRKKLIDYVFGDKSRAELFKEELHKNYEILKKEYRNEYFFKNTLFNKYVLGKYSMNTTAALSEVPIGSSKADFAIINYQKAIVYEIKTDLDNLERLNNQLEDYYKVFSEVYVVTTEKNYYPVYRFIKDFKPSVGIVVLTDKVTLSVRKNAIIDENNLNHENIFKLLRKKEYEEILYYKFKEVPDVKPVYYFKACLRCFKQIPIRECQGLVFSQLRKRMEIGNIEIILDLPIPIRWLVYTGNFTYKELDKIHKKFNS